MGKMIASGSKWEGGLPGRKRPGGWVELEQVDMEEAV
jgi:hypothetical protein